MERRLTCRSDGRESMHGASRNSSGGIDGRGNQNNGGSRWPITMYTITGPSWYSKSFCVLTATVSFSPARTTLVSGAGTPCSSSEHSTCGSSTVWIGPGPHWPSQNLIFRKFVHGSSPTKLGNLSVYRVSAGVRVTILGSAGSGVRTVSARQEGVREDRESWLGLHLGGLVERW